MALKIQVSGGEFVGEMENTVIRENKHQPVVRNLACRPARDINLLCDFR